MEKLSSFQKLMRITLKSKRICYNWFKRTRIIVLREKNPHTHINNFKRITSTLKFRDAPNDVIKLMMFPYSLEGAARVWYDKESSNSILTWEDLVNKFVNQFFPQSKTTHLKNEISRFTQRFEETFGETWERFKEMLRAFPHHGFTVLSQIDTFYNGLNDNDQDSLNAAAGGNLLTVEESSVTCGGPHAHYNCDATNSNQPSVCAATGTYNQVAPQNRASGYMAPPGFAPVQTSQNSFADALLLMPKFASTIKSLLTNKDKLFELAKIPLNENYSAMLLKNILEKLEDPVVDFEADPRVPLILGRSFLRTGRALIDVYGEEITLWVSDEAVTFNLNQTTRYSSTYDDLSKNRIDIINVAKEEYAQEILGFSNNSSGGNLTLTSEPIISDSSPSLTPFEGSDFILEEIKAYLKDESILLKIDRADCDTKGDICLIEKLLNNDPFQLPSIDLKQGEVVKAKSSIKEPSKLELKDLSSHLKYAYLEGVDKLPVTIAKDLKDNEKEALLKVLKSHKQAIAWKTTDIKGIDHQFCTHKILMEEDYKPVVQSKRRVNPKEVVMDDFLVFDDSFSSCLSHLDTMLQWCKDGNLVLNWEKCHFMVKEGIVFGHKISKNRREVDRAKVDVISKLPHPTTVKGVRSFFGHAGFYRRFIQYFSKIARPMTHLLEKETPFVFSKDCIDALKTLKKKLTEAPILVVPDWNLPFELMCDASDFAIGAVLGQRKTKHF
uniref:Reverse transcriptase domain-containing protein n=1 Tax=Tanacetum cinerariifolium TaxID=118510 RepID=A0A6L2J308_TANCI|nr:reverse transcriptase domain-containing protein [Tanacetum cinerariifolium]